MLADTQNRSLSTLDTAAQEDVIAKFHRQLDDAAREGWEPYDFGMLLHSFGREAGFDLTREEKQVILATHDPSYFAASTHARA
jgi:hypothetical protein